MQVSFRLDRERAKKLNDLLLYFGLNSEIASKNYSALIDRMHEISAKAQTIKTLQTAAQENQEIDISCELRFKDKKILKDIDPQTRKTFPKWGDVFFCFRWDKTKGRPEKPLELSNPLEMCRRCKPLLEAWVKEQELTSQRESVNQDLETEPTQEQEQKQTVLKQLLEEPKAEISTPPRPTPKEPVNTWHCPKRGLSVHYSVCLDECKILTNAVYISCLVAHRDISRKLDYWRNTREARLKALTSKKVSQD